MSSSAAIASRQPSTSSGSTVPKPAPKVTKPTSNDDDEDGDNADRNSDDNAELSEDIPISVDIGGDERIKRGEHRTVQIETNRNAICDLRIQVPNDDEIVEDSKNPDTRGRCRYTIEIPDDAKITFGPFSPPSRDIGNWAQSGKAVGTLRIYKGTKDNIVALFSGVSGFRDLTLEYSEMVAKEEGAAIWNSDQHGYVREEKVQRRNEWVDQVELAAPSNGKKKIKK